MADAVDLDAYRVRVRSACRGLKEALVHPTAALVQLSSEISGTTSLPPDERAWLQLELAAALTERSEFEAARGCVAQAEQNIPRSDGVASELRVALADACIGVKDHARAIPQIRSLLSDGVDATPGVARAGNWSSLGDCYQAVGAYREAFDAYAQASDHAERLNLPEAQRAYLLEQVTISAERSERQAEGIALLKRIVGSRNARAINDPLGLIDPLMRIADLSGSKEYAHDCLAAGLRAWRLLARTRHDGRRTTTFPIAARVLGVIGRGRRLRGQWRKADAGLKVAYEHLNRIPDSDPVFVGEVLEHRSLIARDRDDLPAALEFAKLHAELAQQRIGPGCEAFRIVNRYGTLLYAAARFREAVEVIRAALALATAEVPSTDLSQVTTNLGKALLELDLFADAKPQLDRARQILEGAGQSGTLVEVSHLNAEAQWFRGQLRNAEARASAERAVGIVRAVRGDTSASLSTPLNYLGGIAKDEERWADADGFYRQVLGLDGLSRQQRADALQNRALILLNLGQFDEASAHANEAYVIKVALFGEGHERLTIARYMLGLVAHYKDDQAAAMAHFQACLDQELGVYGQDHAGVARTRMKIAAVHMASGRPNEAERELEFVLDSQTERLRRAFQLNNDAQRIVIARDWLSELDAYLGVALSSSPSSTYRYVLDRKGLVTEALAKADPLPDVSSKSGYASTLAELAASLPEGSVVVDYVFHGRAAIGTPNAASKSNASDRRLAAYILRSQREPEYVDLGPAAPIEQAASQFWTALFERKPLSDVRSIGTQLRAAIWEPLRLMDAPHVVISSDGILNQVSFGALPIGAIDWIADRTSIEYVAAVRHLRPRPLPRQVPLSAPLVLAAPDYGSVASGIWDDLDGALTEGYVVAGHLGVEAFIGADTIAKHLRNAACPSILHVATHGFYLPQTATPSRLPPVLAAIARDGDPLGRSALVFAGANEASERDMSAIVTAREIGNLDLSGTELVVLSACQTGMGDIEPFDGAHGLRRAFHAAGAKAIMVSLWNANDRSTASLMDHFYRHLVGGTPAAAALHRAAAETRATFPHPSDWAGFALFRGQAG